MRKKEKKSIKEILLVTRTCNLCDKELTEDTIQKAMAQHKRWYVCKECYHLKIKKRWSSNKANNPLHYKAIILRRPLSGSDADTHFVEELIKKHLGTKCQYCEDTITIKNVSIDHVVPKSHGGSNNKDNLEIVCFRCNLRKGSLTKANYVWLLEVLSEKPELKKAVLHRLGSSGWRFNQ